jgi:hypothetical protein
MRRALACLLLVAGAIVAAPAASQEAARVETFAQLPHWPGYWVAEAMAGTPISGIARPGIAGGTEGPALDTVAIWAPNVPWNDEGRRRVAEVMAKQGGRKGLGWGYPLMMNSATPVQFLITPEEVLIFNAYNEARHIYTDGRDHPPAEDLWPTVTGNSIGHWEGGTLVIDTIMVTNPNEFFQGAPPLSQDARYVERISLEGDKLRIAMTIEDPTTLSAPWKTNLILVRDEGFDRMIQVDWNNDRTGTDGQSNTIEPAGE